MNWTQLLTTEIERTYTTAARLMERVDPDGLDWKPATGGNWMTVGQLLKHIGTACGAGCRGLATGDWGLPPGVKIEYLSAEEALPPADRLPSIGSIGEARKLLLEDKAIALQTIGQIGEDGLGAREVAFPSDGPTPGPAQGPALLLSEAAG